MKIAGVAIASFILGAVVSGLIGLKLLMEFAYQATMGKLSDNVTFYRQIEQEKPELTQKSIESSLDWFIILAEDGESSMWVSPTDNDRRTLARAKELQLQFKQNKSSK